MAMPATSPSTRLPLSLFTIATATMSRSSPRTPEDRPYSPTIERTPTSPGQRAPRYAQVRRERHGRRHWRTDARDPATRRSPNLAVPRPYPRATVLTSPRGARRTRRRHALATTAAGEDERARHGRDSTRARPTTVRVALTAADAHGFAVPSRSSLRHA
jgi:hypothetical protein